MAIDDRGTMEKATAMDFGSMDRGDVANLAEIGANQVIPTLTKSVPGGAALSAGISGIAGLITGDKDAENLAKRFSNGSIKAAKYKNRALFQSIKKKEDRWEGDTFDAVLSTGLGIVGGGLLGGFLGPIGPIIGGFIGGFIGHKIYSSAVEEQAQDPVVMNMQLMKMQEEGQGVPTEAVFATLAANLSGKQGKMVGKILKKYTGTELFSEALADPKNLPKLQAMLHNPVVDDAIRAQTGMPRDANDPTKTVAEQYAELIAGGHMQAKNILNTGEGLYVLSALQQGKSYNVDVPVTPHERGHGKSRNS